MYLILGMKLYFTIRDQIDRLYDIKIGSDSKYVVPRIGIANPYSEESYWNI